MTTSSVAEAVKKARQDVNYSIDDLAETCGLTATEILEIEAGNNEDTFKLTRIAVALQISFNFFKE